MSSATAPEPDGTAPFLDHLTELRNRLIVSAAVLAVASALAYQWAPALTRFLARPLGGLYFSRPLEAFDTRLKLSFFLGLPVALPFVFFQVWLFVRPALGPAARRTVWCMFPASYVLFFVGGAIAFFGVLPPATAFFLSFGEADLRPLISISEYVDFALRLVGSFGLAFQTPLAMLVLAQVGLVNAAQMREARRGVYFAAFVLGAILTSPEVLTQVSLALPLIVLYELGLLLATG